MFVTGPGRRRLTFLGSKSVSAHKTEVSATLIGLHSCSPRNLLSKFSYIRESQTLGNLVPTPRVPRHLGISRGAVIRLPYLIVTIGRSYRRRSGRATHTVPKRATFCSSRSRKLATLGKGRVVGISFVHLSIFGECFLFLFVLFIFVHLKTFVNYCKTTENLSPELALLLKV